MVERPDTSHSFDAQRNDVEPREVSSEVQWDLAEEQLLHASASIHRPEAPLLDQDTEAELRRRLGRPTRPSPPRHG